MTPPHADAVRLEPAYAIVSTYFKLAGGNLRPMICDVDAEMRRFHGLQAFLMSLTGVEAFTNVFFLLHGREHSNPAVLQINAERHGPLVPRIDRLIDSAFGAAIIDQARILQRIRDLYQLRNEIVHPRWEPASMTLGGAATIHIEGLCQNFQSTFESPEFCREAYLWCLLLVMRIGQAAGNANPESFCFFWTGVSGLTEAWIVAELDLQGAS